MNSTASASPTIHPSLGQVESFLAELTASLRPDPVEPKPGRPRVLPALALWAGVLVCVLRGATSQLALWRLLTIQGLWSYPRFPVSDQAIYKRLATAGTEPLEWLFGRVQEALATRLAPFLDTTLVPFASGVYVLDQTALDPVARTLPWLRGIPQRDHRLLPGRLDAVWDVRRQQWERVCYTPDAHQNPKVAARTLLASLPVDALILADLGYFGFPWFDELTDAGYFWLSRLRQKTSYTVLHIFYQQGETLDALIWLGAHRSDRAKHAVRLVQFRHGTTLYRYITNVRDPVCFPPQLLAAVYARRWDIEMALQLVKHHLGLRLLWSAKPVVILQQVWAVLIIAQILHGMRAELAHRAGVDPFAISMPLLVAYVPQLLAEGKDPMAFLLTYGRQARIIRPSRRRTMQAPAIPPEALVPVPPELELERTPRYGNRPPRPFTGTPPYGTRY